MTNLHTTVTRTRRGFLGAQTVMLLLFVAAVALFHAPPVAAVCDTHCTSCSGNVCSGCDTGYSLNLDTGRCASLVCNVRNCLFCWEPDSCAGCIGGMQPSSNNASCVSSPCAVESCSTCVANDPNTCALCNDGFPPEFPGGKCVAPPLECQLFNCTRCEPGTVSNCSVCQDGFELTEVKTCVSRGDSAVWSGGAAGRSVVVLAAVVAALYAALV